MTTSLKSDAGIRVESLKQENDLLLSQLHRAQEELERQALICRSQEAYSAIGTRAVNVSPVIVDQGLSFVSKLTDLLGWSINRKISIIRKSDCFDSDWYLNEYQDVAHSGYDPIEHYLRFGAKEKRNPSLAFDTAWYLERYPDVAKSGMNPLLHYVQLGRLEGRQPARDQQSGADIGLVSQEMQRMFRCIEEQTREIEAFRRASDAQAALVAEQLSRIEALSQSHAEVEADNAVLSEKQSALEGMVASLTQERNEAQAALQSRQADIERLASEREELEQQLFAGQARMETMIKASDAQAALVAEQLSRIEALSQSHAEVEADNAVLSEKQSALEGMVASLTQERNEAQAALQSRQADVERLANEREELERQLFAGQARMETMIKASDAQAALVAEQLSRIEALSQSHAEVEAENAVLTEKWSALEGALVALTQERNEAQAALQSRQADIERLASEREELERQLFAGQARMETMIKASDAQAALVAEQQRQINLLSHANAELETEKAVLSQRRNELEERVTTLNNMRDEVQRNMERESLLAEQQFAELKHWLLSEAEI